MPDILLQPFCSSKSFYLAKWRIEANHYRQIAGSIFILGDSLAYVTKLPQDKAKARHTLPQSNFFPPSSYFLTGTKMISSKRRTIVVPHNVFSGIARAPLNVVLGSLCNSSEDKRVFGACEGHRWPWMGHNSLQFLKEC